MPGVCKRKETKIMTFTLEEKINQLNDAVEGSLGFQSYSYGWEIISFREGTLFVCSGPLYKEHGGYLTDKNFSALVNKAFLVLEESRKKEKHD